MIEALSAALVRYYPFAGRLQKDRGGRLEINCNGAGVLFVKATADTRIDELMDCAPGPELTQLVPKLDVSQDWTAWPLLIVQVTFFECGSITLGVSWNHRIADGVGFFQFMETWSSLARGVAPRLEPVFDRTPLKARSPPVPMFPHVEYQPSPKPIRTVEQVSESAGLHETAAPVNGLATQVFKLSREQLQDLKASCNDVASGLVRHTTFEVVAGHIWRCFCEARELSPDQVTRLNVAVDGRSRFRPPLPEGYCGNVVFRATPILTAGDVVLKPLNSTAGKIHDAVARMDDAYLRSAIDYLELHPDMSKLETQADKAKSPNLSITSWIRMPMYETDFGWGKPMLVTPARAHPDGVVIVFPATDNTDSLAICVGLQAHQMRKFKGLFMDLRPTHAA